MNGLRGRTSWEEPNGIRAATDEIPSAATELTGPTDLDDLVADLADDR